jgi:hypothetical protein
VSQAKKAAETAARKAELKKLADEEAQELAAAVKKGSPATKKTPVAAPKVCVCECVLLCVYVGVFAGVLRVGGGVVRAHTPWKPMCLQPKPICSTSHKLSRR